MTPRLMLLLSLVIGTFTLSGPGFSEDSRSPGEWVSLDGAPGSGPAWELQTDQLGPDRIRLTLSLHGFFRTSREHSRFQDITLPDAGNTRIVGRPSLPQIVGSLAFGSGEVRILAVSAQTTRLKDLIPTPFTPRPNRCGGKWTDRLTCDQEFYARGEAGPEEWASLETGARLRGQGLARILLTPLRYHPETRELEVATRLRVDLLLPPVEAATLAPRVRNSTFLRELDRVALNGRQVSRDPVNLEAERLIIIAEDSLAPAMEEFVQWKRARGLITDLVLLSEVGSTSQAVGAFIEDQYFNGQPPVTHVLLVGDGKGDAVVPFVTSSYGCASDFLYTTLEGDDLYSEVLIGRFSAQTLDQARLLARKVIWYEQELLAQEGAWIPNSICISSSEGEGGSSDDLRSNTICDLQADHGFDVQKFYLSMGNDSATNITAAINSGLGWINYLGHGSGTAWETTSPPYSVNHVNNLTNTNMLPFIMDISCSNGEFDRSGGDCLAEAWVKAGSEDDLRGAMSSYSASTPAAWDEPAEMAIGFTRALLEGGAESLGEACLSARAYMLEQIPQGSSEEVCHQYVIFGDPTLLLRTRIPGELEVVHPETITLGPSTMSVEVRLDGAPCARAMVTLFREDGTWTSKRTDEWGRADLELDLADPGAAELVVMARDATPYRAQILVQNPGCGILTVNPKVISCQSGTEVRLYDKDLLTSPSLLETAVISRKWADSSGSEDLVLVEDSQDGRVFKGHLSFPESGEPGHGSTLTLTYQDQDCLGEESAAEARLTFDCLAPVISQVEIQDLTYSGAVIRFLTDEPARAFLLYGQGEPSVRVESQSSGTEHRINLKDLAPGTTWVFTLEAVDAAGNRTVPAGGPWSFETTNCSPKCGTRQCGTDGCGGTCGTCCQGQTCEAGQCVGGLGCQEGTGPGCNGCACEACVCAIDDFCCTSQWDYLCAEQCVDSCGGCPPQEASCQGKECGDNGCGNSCGTCPSGYECNGDGMCVVPCVPRCEARRCGDDGCGGSCGTCLSWQACSEDGGCYDPCLGTGREGCCDQGILRYCDQGGPMETDCRGQGLECGWNGDQGWYDCTGEASAEPLGLLPLHCPGTCIPACEGRLCGDDGCGNTCGACAEGEECSPEGQCLRPCPDLPEAGCCNGDLAYACNPEAGTAEVVDCRGQGLTCGWTEAGYGCAETRAEDPAGLAARLCPGACEPLCGDRECGDDGCGGTCGTCGDGASCTDGGLCLTAPEQVEGEPAADIGAEADAGDQVEKETGRSHGCDAGSRGMMPWSALVALGMMLILRRWGNWVKD